MLITTGDVRRKLKAMSHEKLALFALSVVTHLYASGVTHPLNDETRLEPTTDFTPDTIEDVAWDVWVYIGSIGDGRS